MLFDLIAAGIGPGAVPGSAATTASDGGSILWPMFLMALFAVVAVKVWQFSRRVKAGALPRRLPKDWEDKFWSDLAAWRADPLNR